MWCMLLHMSRPIAVKSYVYAVNCIVALTHKPALFINERLRLISPNCFVKLINPAQEIWKGNTLTDIN